MKELIVQAEGDMGNRMFDTMGSFLDENYFDTREVHLDGWNEFKETLNTFEEKVESISQGIRQSTLHYIKTVLANETNSVDLEMMYKHKEVKISELLQTLRATDADGDVKFKKEADRFTRQYNLAWKVGYLFQHRAFYDSIDKNDFPKMVLLNQPLVNQRMAIGEQNLWEVLNVVKTKGTSDFQAHTGLVGPYEVGKEELKDTNSNSLATKVNPMINIGGNTDSMCYACPMQMGTVRGLFEVLTGVEMNEENFPNVFGKGKQSDYERINFALYAVLEALKRVYGNLSVLSDYHDLFLVCHLQGCRGNTIDLNDSSNEEPLTFPIGVRELMKQTALKFQAITRLRFSWGDAQKRQSGVTTYLCGHNPFLPMSQYRMKFDSQMYPKKYIGKRLVNHLEREFCKFLSGDLNVTIVLVRLPRFLQDRQRKHLYTMCEAVGVEILRSMSTTYGNQSSMGQARTYKEMFSSIALKTDRSYLYPIAGNENWVDHFFYKRWDLLGMVFDDKAGDLTKELRFCKSNRRRQVIPDPRSARVSVQSGQSEEMKEYEEEYHREDARERKEDPDYTDEDGEAKQDGVIWETDTTINVLDENIHLENKRAFQYFFYGRPNKLPRPGFLSDRDHDLDTFEITKARYKRQQSRISAGKRVKNRIEKPEPLEKTSYIGQNNFGVTVPLRYIGHPKRTPLPRCAWCIVGFFSECASGTPETALIAKQFVSSDGRRNGYEFQFLDSVMGYRAPYVGQNFDSKVTNYCFNKQYCYLVRTC